KLKREAIKKERKRNQTTQETIR
ncbi:hypothetical protein LCGC14_2361060, partial [marine sediment metagenome]